VVVGEVAQLVRGHDADFAPAEAPVEQRLPQDHANATIPHSATHSRCGKTSSARKETVRRRRLRSSPTWSWIGCEFISQAQDDWGSHISAPRPSAFRHARAGTLGAPERAQAARPISGAPAYTSLARAPQPMSVHYE